MLLDKEAILKFLPHRDPFLFIDSVESISLDGKPIEGLIERKDALGSEVIAHYRTRADHEIFKGHFPGNPILPGVVQVEMMAQATAFIYNNIKPSPDNPNKEIEVALVSVQGAKFRKPVLPEMDLVIKTKIVKARGPMMSSDCQLFHGDELMSETSVLASVKY